MLALLKPAPPPIEKVTMPTTIITTKIIAITGSAKSKIKVRRLRKKASQLSFISPNTPDSIVKKSCSSCFVLAGIATPQFN
jgi:hypothetical protein